MKSTKNIIDSIGKGVSLALDDFDFNDEQDNQKQDIIDTGEEEKLQFCKHIIFPKILHEDAILEFYYSLIIYKDNLKLFKENLLERFPLSKVEVDILMDYLKLKNVFYREYVDLNLPSGTLWCTENLEKMDYVFTINRIQFNAENGSYYVWGDTMPNRTDAGGDKTEKLKNTYIKQFKDKSKNSFKLELEDDAAYNVDKHYRTPTMFQFLELFTDTKQYHLKLDEYMPDLGYLLVSKKDPLNFIWFPYEDLALYQTSELYRENPKNNQLKDKIYLYLAKIKMSSIFNVKCNSYIVWNNESIPAVTGKIRPIYIE